MLPLQGVKVLEIGQNLAGPYASEILGMLGAEVVKIERPEGDDARGWGPPFHAGIASSFHAVNRNKRSVALDLRDKAALAWLREFMTTQDIFIQNMRPGSLEAFGLGAEALRALNPRLIYCSLHAFGAPRTDGDAAGLRADRAGLRRHVQRQRIGGGAAGARGHAGARPRHRRLGGAGLPRRAAMRGHTGEGCIVDTSLFETGLGWMAQHFAGFNESGRQPPRHR